MDFSKEEGGPASQERVRDSRGFSVDGAEVRALGDDLADWVWPKLVESLWMKAF
jgi:hypothetical protein